MATTNQWGGLGLAPGVTITTSTVGTGDTAFSAVTGTAPVTANALLRWPSIQFDQAATFPSYVQLSTAATTTGAIRWLAQYSAAATASVSLVQGMSGGGAAQQWRVEMAGTGGAPPGEVRLRDAANALLADSGAVGIPFGATVYCEYIWNGANGTFNLYLPGVGTPTFTVTVSAAGATAIDTLRLGNIVTTTQPRFWIDDIVVTNTAAPIPQVGASSDPTNIRPLQYNCNRVAGTLVNGVPTLDAQGAANRWAFTSGLDLVHALNVKAGNTLPAYKDLLGVCNQLAGTTGLGENGASSRWAAG